MLLPEGKRWVLLLRVCEKEAGGSEMPHTWRWRPREARTGGKSHFLPETGRGCEGPSVEPHLLLRAGLCTSLFWPSFEICPRALHLIPETIGAPPGLWGRCIVVEHRMDSWRRLYRQRAQPAIVTESHRVGEKFARGHTAR